MADILRVSLAGVTLDLASPASTHLREDSQWRLRQVYDPFLATCSLPPQGVAVDIGAGFGAFALPFARRYPGWTIWCFEPGREAFAALSDNIARLGLANVRAHNLAVAEAGEAPPPLREALVGGPAAALATLCPQRSFRRHRRLDGFHDARRQESAEFEPVTCPTLPAEALAALRPTLVKLTAPFAERGILRALADAGPAILTGESWEVLPPDLLPASTVQAWMPFARAPGLGLRRLPGASRPALDVVIEVRDPGGPLQASLAALPPEPGIALHLVLPPGMPAPALPDPGIALLQAQREGTSAAFNLGRRRSTGSHLVFLRSGDRPEPGSLRALVRLAELSGAELVQGGGPEGPGWANLPRNTSFDLQGQGGALFPSGQLLAAFGPVRARLWRRDFLDAQNLWFPEHLTDFSEHHLHFQALPRLADVPVLPDARILPHPGGLLRHEALHLPEVFRLAIKQALVKGWRDPSPLVEGFAPCAREAAQRLLPEWRAAFLEALAEVQLMAEKAFGPALRLPPESAIPGLAERVAALRPTRAGLAEGYAWGWEDAPALHPAMQAQRQLWKDPK